MFTFDLPLLGKIGLAKIFNVLPLRSLAF